MTEPLDVSLRVRLAYEAGGSAKAAVADLEAIKAGATRLGGGIGPERLGQDMTKLAGFADLARRAISSLEIEAARLAGAAAGSTRLAASLEGMAAPAATARREIDGIASAAEKVGMTAGPGRLSESFGGVSAAAITARREIDFVGIGAARAERDLQRLGRAMQAANGSGGGDGSGGGSRHGVTPFMRAAAMPFRAERKVGFLASSGGMAGLAAGYGLYEVGKALAETERQAMEFESAMADVRRSVGDMPAEGLKTLENAILRTSRATGIATAELAKMTAAGAAAGRPVADLPQFMELSAKTAGAMGMKVDQAAGTLSRLGTEFGLDQRGIQNAADAAAFLQERAGANGTGTLDFLAATGGAAKMANMSPNKVAAYGGTMQQLGMSSEDAASAFQNVLNKLLQGREAGEAYTGGLHRMIAPDSRPESGYALQRIARADPSAAMLRLLDDMKTLSKERRFSILTQMFGEEDGARLGRLSEHTDALRRNLGLMEDQAAQSGAVDRVLKIFDSTTSAKIDKASTALANFAAKLGQVFAPSVGAGAEGLAKIFNGLSDAIDRTERNLSAVDILRARRSGKALTLEQKAAIAADPQLKAMVGDPDKPLPAEAPSLVPQPPLPRNGKVPELSTDEVSAERERVRRRLQDEIEDLQRQKTVGAGGPLIDRQIEAARRRLKPFEETILPPIGSGKHAGLAATGLFQPASFVEGGDAAATRSGDAGLQAMIEAGTKAGVIAGFREVLTMREGNASSGDIVSASWEGGDGGTSGGGIGDGSGAGGGSAPRRRSIRYGGGYGPRGRGGGGGGGGDGRPSTPLGKTGSKFDGKAPAIMRGLMERYGLTKEQAAGVVGNLGHESAGFTAYHEGGQAAGKGGVGWAQWTRSRRRDFEAWTKAHGLNPTSDDASWRYLTEGDPETKGAIEAVKKTGDAHSAAVAWEGKFERASVKAYGSRFKFADRALALGPGGKVDAVAGTSLDPAQRQEAMERAKARVTPPAHPISPRFADPKMITASAQLDAGGPPVSSQGRRQAAAGSSVIQHFHGNHDPAQTAHFAMVEQNREIRRAQGRALHTIGSVA